MTTADNSSNNKNNNTMTAAMVALNPHMARAMPGQEMTMGIEGTAGGAEEATTIRVGTQDDILVVGVTTPALVNPMALDRRQNRY